jgi:hypothetical protein
MILLILLTQLMANPQDWGVGTLMGALNRSYSFPRGKGGVYDIPSTQTMTGIMPIYFSKKNHPADLIIILPGVFGSAESRINTTNLEVVEKFDVHVLSVPNFFAEKYIKQKPLYSKDPVALDLKIINESIDWAIKKIGRQNINKIHLFAESLGSFMASGLYAVDSQTSKPLINGEILLMWPPLDIKVAVNNFDHIIDFYRAYASECSFWNLVQISLKDRWHKDLSKHEILCARSFMLIKGFVSTISRVSKEFNPLFSDQRNHLKFESFIDAYSPAMNEMLIRHDMRLSLAYWLDQGQKRNPRPVTIFSGRTDFLNWGLSMDEWLKGRPGEYVYENFSWGGHSGPIGYPDGEKKIIEWLKKVINKDA